MDEKINRLRSLIDDSLMPLVDRDYVFLDLPYHPNVGDTLIALAARTMLKETGHLCLYEASEFTYDGRQIADDVLIVFNGGGNFGDLWMNYTDFRNGIIRRHPNNRFLLLPQSVCYLDDTHLKSDAQLYAACGRRMTICARDSESYELLCRHFSANNVLLVPDMAFRTQPSYLEKARRKASQRALFVRRSDKELLPTANYSIVPPQAEVHDWPTLERWSWLYDKYWRLKSHLRRHRCPRFLLHGEDYVWQLLILPYNLRSGIRFVSRYSVVYTTRLHVAILAILLGRQVVFFDNSYHKNSALYNTWLKDCQGISMAEEA